MEAQSNTKMVDNPDSRSKTCSSNNVNGNSSNRLTNNSNSSNNTNSNGNNSDNSAGSGMISLGNNSFGFNFDSEEGVSNLSPPNSDHGGGTKSNTSANVAVSTVGATAVASSSLSNQPQTPPPPLPVSQRQKQANDDAAAQTVSKLNAIASQSFISTSSHSNDHNNTNKNNTSNNEELPNDQLKRKSSSGSSGYRSDDEGSGSGNSSEEKQQQCISSKVAMKKQRDMSQQSLTTKNIAQHNVKNEQQDISSSTSLQVAAGTTSVAAGSGSGISETPQQLLQSFSSNNHNDDNTNNIKHEENFNDDNDNNDNNDNENPKKKKKIDDQKREERNAREKERSYRIAAQINELRTLLSHGGVIVPKGTKNAVLTEAANYIKMLQEHQYKSEIHRQQLIQQMQMIGSGAIGPQAANAIRHVAAQNGVWSLGKFGGVPPRTAAAHDQQQAQAGLTGVGQQQQSQQGNQQSAFLKSIDDNDYRFIFNSCSIPMAIASMGGAFIDCNQIFIELSQYSKQELLALTIFNLTARSDLQHAFDLVSQMITPPIGNDEDERNMQQQHSPSCVLRGNMKNRTDLGLNITLIRDDDGIAKCFCVSLIKNPASPFDTSMPVHVTPAHVYVQQQQQQGQFQNDGMKQQVGGNNMTSPAFMSG
jgi:PAS domain-containing protein